MNNENFSPSKAISNGWKLTKDNLMVMVGLLLMGVVVLFIFSAFGGNDMTSAHYWIMYIVTMLVSWYFSLGYSKITLDLTDGDEATFSAFRKVLPLFINYIVTSILINLIVIAGLMILLIPGLIGGFLMFPELAKQLVGIYNPTVIAALIFSGAGLLFFLYMFLLSLLGMYLWVRLSYATLAIISDKCGPMEALKKSWTMTRNRTGNVIVLYILFVLINILGIMALFIGVFVTLTICQLAYTSSYRQIEKDMAGQPSQIGLDDNVMGTEV